MSKDVDHMADWKVYGRTPEGLRQWARAIIKRPELRCGYSECVVLSAAEEMERLNARINQLESYLDKTADGKLVCETDAFYCPKCGGKLRAEYNLAYCDNCPNPDDGCWPNLPPLPLSYGLTLAIESEEAGS